MLGILIVINLETRSQISANDTLCFRVIDIQNVLIAAKQKKVADSLVILLRSDISILSQKITALELKDSVNKEIDLTRLSQIQVMKDQRKILEDQIVLLNKEIKKWKRKQRWTAIGGIVAVAATIFITK
jgi:hypothetical protein